MFPIQPAIFKDDNEYWVRLVVDNVDPNKYLISSHGNVYDFTNDKMVYPVKAQNGYLYIYLDNKDGKKKMPHLLHRLIAMSFVFNPSLDKNQVNHITGDKNKNHAKDLEWTTCKENVVHGFEHGLFDNNIGENSHLSKLTNEEVIQICEYLSYGYRYEKILLLMGMENTDNNRDLIGNIKRRIAWTHISKNYEFPDSDLDQRFRVHSKEEVIQICKYLEMGMDTKSIYENTFHKPYLGSKKCKGEYELIRLIKNREQFTDISKDYNF